MRTKAKWGWKRGFVIVLCLVLAMPGAVYSKAAARGRFGVIKLSSKRAFRAVHVGDSYTLQWKKNTIQHCQSSKNSVVEVKGKTITAKNPGRAVVTMTNRKNRTCRLSLWVRPVTEYNRRTQKVCLVGNSLLRTGGQADYLKGIAKLYGQPVQVLNENVDGYYLWQHLRDVQNGKRIATSLKTADAVVFQEYGNHYERTMDSILQLKSYCKKGAKLYYYATEFDLDVEWKSRRTELEKNGFTIINAGALVSKMYPMGFLYQDLHLPNDYHPNPVNGYVCAMLTYAQIFEEKCCDFPTKQYLNYFEDILPGKSRTKKWKQFQKICREADKLAA